MPFLKQGEFQGQAAMIVGAGGVIGSAVARRLGEAGANVCLADLVPPKRIAEEINRRGFGEAVARVIDVRSGESVRSCFDSFIKETGRLDIMVHVAGVTSFGSFESLTEEIWDHVQSINLRGVFLCNQAAIKPMKAGGYGRIINIGSVLAKNGGNSRPWINPQEQTGSANAAYGAAKAGVHAMTLYLAKELASSNITVNAVAPGPIQTPMTTALPTELIRNIPVGRLGSPDEIAEAVAFLCSPHSSFITGEILDVNGGLWVD